MDKFRSFFLCGKHHENWKYLVLKPGDTLLSCFHMIVVQYHILLERNESSLKHNLNLSTIYKAYFSQKSKEPPGVSNRLWICSIDWLPLMQCHQCIQAKIHRVYFLCSQVASHQCPAMMQPVTVEVIFQLIVEVHLMFNCNQIRILHILLYEFELRGAASVPVLHSQQTML